MIIEIKDATEKVSEIIIDSVKRQVGNLTDLSVSFSGGLDSSFLVYLIQNYTTIENYNLITACFPDTYDVENSKSSAELLGLVPEFIFLDHSKLISGIEELSEIIDSKNPVVISYMLPFYYVCKVAKYDHILLGQGSDELFGGYHWQSKLENKDFILKTKNIIGELVKEVEIRERKIANFFGKKVLMPFLEEELIDYVLPLPKSFRANEEHEKYLLRLSAKDLNLSEEIVWKHKKAAQYGSGIMREMKKIKNKTKLKWL